MSERTFPDDPYWREVRGLVRGIFGNTDDFADAEAQAVGVSQRAIKWEGNTYEVVTLFERRMRRLGGISVYRSLFCFRSAANPNNPFLGEYQKFEFDPNSQFLKVRIGMMETNELVNEVTVRRAMDEEDTLGISEPTPNDHVVFLNELHYGNRSRAEE